MGKNLTCDGCGHPSAKKTEHGFNVCSACYVEVSPTRGGKFIEVKTTGDLAIKRSRFVPDPQ